MNSELIEIIWQISEEEFRSKDISWRWLSLIAAIVLLAFAFWQKNFLFAIFVVIAFLTFNVLSGRFPTIWEFKLNKEEISLNSLKGEGKKSYSLKDIESFDIHEEIGGVENYKELVLKLKSQFSPFLKINIHSEDEQKINEFLLKFIPREEHPKSLIDSLQKLTGF